MSLILFSINLESKTLDINHLLSSNTITAILDKGTFISFEFLIMIKPFEYLIFEEELINNIFHG
jgi:hypothetical protein